MGVSASQKTLRFLLLYLLLGGCVFPQAPPREAARSVSTTRKAETPLPSPEDEARAERQRAALESGIGSLTHASVGYYMDLQESRMRKRLNDTGVSLRRVDNRLKLVLPGNLTFKVGQSTLNPSFREVLGTVADLLKFYEKTLIEISGHSDSSGGPAMNERLSLQRAQTVAVFLVERGVQTMRIYSQGIADRLPIASNDSKEGRALNRRVELFLVPLVE